MLKPLRCDFLTGPLTDSNSMEILKNAFEQQTSSVHEMLYYKKNGTGIWLEVRKTSGYFLTIQIFEDNPNIPLCIKIHFL